MPDFLPFRGIRYRAMSDLSSVVAPPYDVIDEEDRARLEAADPHNAVRLNLPQAAPPADPYRAAASTLADWLSSGVVAPDPEPAIYRYEMRFTGATGDERRTVGVIGALKLPHDGEDDVLAHERTLPKARTDRLALLRATRANFDPIWCLSLASGLTELVDSTSPPVATALDEHGTTHALTPITDPASLDAIRGQVAGTPVVLADGHHRYETACIYRREHPDDPSAEFIMTFVVELDEAMLDVRAIHRLVHGAPSDLRGRLTDWLRVTPVGPNTEPDLRQLLAGPHEEALTLVDRDGLAELALTARAHQMVTSNLPPELRGVDAARFDVVVRPAVADAALSYRNDALTVASMVEKGAADAAVLLRPVTVEQIRAAALARLRMPEKTTFFWPKPRTGMVLRRLDS